MKIESILTRISSIEKENEEIGARLEDLEAKATRNKNNFGENKLPRKGE